MTSVPQNGHAYALRSYSLIFFQTYGLKRFLFLLLLKVTTNAVPFLDSIGHSFAMPMTKLFPELVLS